MLGARYSPIGLDIGTRCVHAVQLCARRGKVTASAWTTMARPNPGASMTYEEAARIAGTLDRLGFVGRSVTASMPEDRIVSGALELPPRQSGAPLDSIARQEMARAAKCEPAELEVCWWELPGTGRAGEPTHGLAVACRHAESLAVINALGRTGLEVDRLSTGETMLAQAAMPLAGPPPELTAVLDLGWHSVQLLVLHGKLLVYQRAVRELGLSHVCAAIAKQCALDNEQAELALRDVGCASDDASRETNWPHAQDIRAAVAAMIDEAGEQLRLSFVYAQRRFDGTPARVLVAGGGADLPGVIDRLSGKAELPLKAMRADQMVEPAPGGLSPLGAMSVQALALARAGWMSGKEVAA